MTKKGKKMVLVAARLMEYDEKLSRIESLIEYENILTGIKSTLSNILWQKDMKEFQLMAKKTQNELNKLEMGEILRTDFSCYELASVLVRKAASEIKN